MDPGKGQTIGRDQYRSWVNEAPPADVIEFTKTALRRVAQLPREHRDQFLADIGRDPAFTALLEEVKTPA